MDLRDGLLILGVVLLLAFFADLARRLLTRNKLKLKIDKRFQDLPDTDLSAELPGGGKARVVTRNDAASGSGEPAIKEPTFELSDADAELLSRDDRSSSRREPHIGAATDDDLDLLLTDDLKGVGEARSLLARGEQDGISASKSTMETVERSAHQATEPALILNGSEEAATPAADLAVEPKAATERLDATVEDQPESSSPQDDPPAQSQSEKASIALADEPLAVDLMRPVAEILQEKKQQEPKEDNLSVSRSMAPAPDSAPSRSQAVGEPEPAQAEREPMSAEQDDLLAAAGATTPAEPAATVQKSVAATTRTGRSRTPRKGRPEVQASFFDLDPELAPEPDKPEAGAGRRKGKPPAEAKEPVDEVLVIVVKARHDPFKGTALFRLVEACGLTWGASMKIYHRHEDGDGVGNVQFSMVNLVQPGTFEPASAERFSTPGISLFLNMSEPTRLMEAFDCMLATAQCLADNLDGELRDDQRSSLRAQTIEHYRNKVREFERRRLARRA